jgi:FMN phosphatase YigB (HAD superfamily)
MHPTLPHPVGLARLCAMIAAVTFDLWDTLVTDRDLVRRQALRATRLREMLAPLGVYPDDEELARAFARSWDNFDRVWNGEHRTPTAAESTDVVLDTLGVDAPAGARVTITRLLEELVLEVPPVPVEGGMSKPDPRVFALVLDRLGARPDEAAHVGDIARTDIAGARRAGMRAVHFVGMNRSDAEGSTADIVIERLRDLPAALKKLSR